MIQLSEEDAYRIADSIRLLMYHYSYNPNGSDYVCLFCNERETSSNNRIIHRHRDDCEGEEFLKLLSPKD